MKISDEIREQVIREYEQQKHLEACKTKAKTKPLGRAQQYFRLLIERSGGLTCGGGWWVDANERVKKAVCRKYNLLMVTELKPEDYDEANEYAIELFTKETEDGGHKKDRIDTWGLPWVRNKYTGRFQHTYYPKTWDEWKTICYDKVH